MRHGVATVQIFAAVAGLSSALPAPDTRIMDTLPAPPGQCDERHRNGAALSSMVPVRKTKRTLPGIFF